MYFIKDVLVSDGVLEAQFACNIGACKGACCWEGDFGAPLDPAEVDTLAAIFNDVKPFLSLDGISAIESMGTSVYYPDMGKAGTPLIDGGPCAYLVFEPSGVAHCGIEKAWRAGMVDFQKPISCHLYPIRVLEHPAQSFEAINYDQWDICSAACSKGQKEGISLISFAKDALIRKYGADFYDELVAAANKHLLDSTEEV